ncbi:MULTISPECIES: Gfo/Idh/MocA family oxidoreductase [unclassified Roseitalea]|uniref:Gfo/Idh/MocA family protein n=1 Tax=unclassified Roseitalea TaxID=2639107 RepID=UPI00273ECB5D|nr:MULTISPECIES: Gfo/Idh/MocA family oxidoreductase [unclassified Roseitalea]
MDEKGTNWGIWATGTIAAKFADDLDHVPGARKAAVCSRDAERAHRFANAHGFARAHGDGDAFLADPDVDVVYIASPHPAHKAQAMAAIGAGKSVLIEKPITMHAADARAIGDAARTAGVFAMEAMWTRFLPAVQRARAMIEAGEIGAVRRAEASLVFHRPFEPGHRLFDPALGGGACLDLGVYPISVAAHLLGRPQLVESAWLAAPNGVDISATFTLACGNAPISVEIGFVEREDQAGENSFTIFGEAGTLRLDRPFLAAQALSVWQRPMQTAPSDRGLRGRLARRLSMDGRKRLRCPALGSGLAHQAVAVQQALARGDTQHALMPIDESAAAIDIIERILAEPAAGGRPATARTAAG